MEFNAPVGKQIYNFSRISSTSYLVTGKDLSVIVYKARRWHCADNVPRKLVATLGRIIEETMRKEGRWHMGQDQPRSLNLEASPGIAACYVCGRPPAAGENHMLATAV
jgi:hypothetical protein